ncbi:inositol monophosphatase family protein [Novosphingobium tardum]|uniref:Inositol monophosphatase family protein n=1 Tax=Novosphingobium tardum TaxID=1538021 RepID=A0ABV8RPQ6_9SPHN
MTRALTRPVHELMRTVGERVIMPRFQSLAAHQIVQKAADDVVTIADREAEELLAEGLTRILPDAALVGEEAAHADRTVMGRLGQQLCWIVDPLDGTNNFALGKRPFGIIVALAQAGEMIAGWIYDPVSGRLCHAHKGGGSFIGDDWVTARASGLSPPIAAVSVVFMDPARRAAVTGHILPHYTVVDIPRCAAEQYPRLVLGENDCSIFERTLPWDHAAGVLFVNEAGGRAARPDGSDYRVDDDRRGLIGASTPALWDEMAARLAALPSD